MSERRTISNARSQNERVVLSQRGQTAHPHRQLSKSKENRERGKREKVCLVSFRLHVFVCLFVCFLVVIVIVRLVTIRA